MTITFSVLKNRKKNHINVLPTFKKIGKRGGLIGNPKQIPVTIPIDLQVSLEGVFSITNIDGIKEFLDNQENFVTNFENAQWKIVELVNKQTVLGALENYLERSTKWEQLDIERKEKAAQRQKELAGIEEKLKEKMEVIEACFPNRCYFSFEEKKNIAYNKPFAVPNGGVNLGRCYNKYSFLVFYNGADEIDPKYIPKGNFDNYGVGEKGTHPKLGEYIETTCTVDSSD